MTQKAQSTAAQNAAAELIPPPDFIGVDLKELARLASEASSIELVRVTTPGIVGIPDEIPVAIVNGRQPEVRDISALFDKYRVKPARKTGQAETQTIESFHNLVNRHKTADSAIFADMDWRKPSMTAVIDYHPNAPAGGADNGRHRIHYAYPLSEEWQKWIEMNGEPMSQQDFAYFLEDRAPELSSPTEEERIRLERDFATTVATPSQLVELSRGLQVHVESRIKGVTTLQTGEGQISWDETHTDGDGKPLKVPGIFILSIAPFFQGDKIRIPVRLRYRAAGQQVKWFYQIYRPDQAITEHVRHTLIDAARETGLPTYEGKPEM